MEGVAPVLVFCTNATPLRAHKWEANGKHLSDVRTKGLSTWNRQDSNGPYRITSEINAILHSMPSGTAAYRTIYLVHDKRRMRSP